MKIAWFTPFSPKSSIGEISNLVCEELQKLTDVDIYTFNQGELIPSSLNIVRYKSLNFDRRNLEKYDYIVYNMGNFAGNHREIWEVMQRHPGILVLHDQMMQNFFQQITMVSDYGGNSITGEQEYLSIMRTCYGMQGEDVGKALFKSYLGNDKQRIWNSEAAMAFPLLEPVLAKSTAVFSHALFFIKKIKDMFFGPTGFAYLPHSKQSIQADLLIPAEFSDTSKALVVSSGLVHPVKRIAQVAEMLLENPDIVKRVRYLVIGDFGGPYGDYLYSLASGPLKGCLYLLGYLSNEMMEAYLQKADFCVNLRYPNSEVCSKALIDQMAYENPVIVLNQGIYNELPNDSVVKIRLENEMTDLANAFRYLLDNAEMRYAIGNQALHFVEENCTPEVYVAKFSSFLEKIPKTIASDKVINDTIYLNRMTLTELSFNQNNLPSLIDTVSRELSNVTGAISLSLTNNKVIGLWFGFPYVVDLKREGITRFLLYMLMALLENYPIDCEIWAYSFNEEEIRISFETLLKKSKFEKRVRVITEKNYKEMLDIPSYKYELPLEINENLDNLSYLAKLYSNATCFITAIVYLDNVIGIGRPVFVPVHDLGIHVHYDDFILMDPLYKARHVDIRSRAENLARSDAFIFCESEYVRHSQVHNFITSIDESHTNVVYFPVFVPENLDEYLLEEKEIRQKFGLKNPYLFYPTQVRPYKNIEILIEALSILRERNINIELVLTGKPSNIPIVENAINTHKLNHSVISLSTVREDELFSLYHYSAATTVPTLFEGGFPLQAMEALYIGSPLVLSDIPVVRERIEFCGMSVENCGLELFDPHSPLECANAVERVILNRERTLTNQKPFREKFLTYTWKDAAAQYYNMFFNTKRAENE